MLLLVDPDLHLLVVLQLQAAAPAVDLTQSPVQVALTRLRVHTLILMYRPAEAILTTP